MRVHSLQLKNFRQFVDSSLEFPLGIVGIVGPNGSGKTSVLEAISFALFGARAIRGKLSDLTRRAATKNEKLEVQLIFEHVGRVFRVCRFLEKAELFQAGESEPIVEGTSAVTYRIEEILGMTFEEFSNTYFTSQKALEFLSGKKGSVEREKFVLNMLGLEKVDRALELLRNDKKDLKYKLQALKNIPNADEKLLEEKTSEKNNLKTLRKEKEKEVKLYSAQEKELKKFKTVYKTSLKQSKIWNDFKSEEKTLKSKINDILNSEKKIKFEKENFEKKFKLDDFDKLKKKVVELDKKNTPLKEKLEDLKESNAKELKKKEFELRVLKNEKSQNEEKLNELIELGEKSLCPTCNQELSASFNSLLLEAKKRNQVLSKKIQKTQSSFDQFRKEVTSQEDELRKIVDKKREELKVAREKSQELALMSERYKHFSENIAKVKEEKEALEKKLITVEKEIKKLDFDIDEFKKLEKQIETQKSLVQVLQVKKVRLDGEIETKKTILERIDIELSKLKEKQEGVKKLTQELEFLEEGDAVLAKFRTFLNSSLRPRMAEIASDFLAELTDGRYHNIDIAKDFSPTVWEDGEPKAVISGGEEDVLHLCIRLAMSQLLAERAGKTISMLVLDEVFGSLDEIRRANVMALFDRLSTRFEQIILVTHCEDIKDSVEHLISLDYDEATADLRISEIESGVVFDI